MTAVTEPAIAASSSLAALDAREQLYNQRLTGSIQEVQQPAECITSLHGILFDLDPDLYRPGNGVFEPDPDAATLLANIRPVLERHPLARHAEARASGRGLRLIVWMDPPAELTTAGEQKRWAGVVQAVQSSLPVDPGMPGITALTRPAGSINTKAARAVARLAAGTPVSPADVEGFAEALRKAPFAAVAEALLGGRRVTPCPLCGKKDSQLSALDRQGRCYGGRCGTVTLADLLDGLVYAPSAEGPVAAGRADCPGTPAP